MTLAILSVALVTALYLRRNRPTTVRVPFLRLFTEGREEGKWLRIAELLRHPLSLLFQLVLLVLILFLRTPPATRSEVGKSHVLLIDASEGTARLDAKRESELMRALAQAEQFASSLPEEDEVHFVALSSSPSVIATSHAGERREVPRDVTPVSGEPNLEEALSLAAGLAGRKQNTFYLLSRRERASLRSIPPEKAKKLLELPVPPAKKTEGAELSIAEFGARRYPRDPSLFEAVVEVVHSGGKALPAEFIFAAAQRDGTLRPFYSEKRTLGTAEREVVRFAELSSDSGAISLEVRRLDGASDGLLLDESDFATIERRTPVLVEVVGSSSTFLDAALLLDPFLRRAAPGERPDVELRAELATAPASLTRPTLLLGPLAEAGHNLVETGAPLSNFGIDNWQEHPIWRDVDPYDIQILRGHRLKPARGDLVLADSGGAPIVTSGERSAQAFVALGFRPEDSDFVLRASFPLFLSNAVAFLAATRAPLASRSYDSHRLLELTLEGAADGIVEVYGPLGTSPETLSTRVRGEHVELVLERPGLYRFKKDELLRFVAVRRGKSSQASGDMTPLTPATGSRKNQQSSVAPLLRMELLESGASVLLALLLLAEWWSYHRRITA
jgi:hypothetical protein